MYATVAYFIISSTLWNFGKSIAKAYTKEEELLDICEKGLKMMAIFYFFHGIGKTLEGTVRGLGKHEYATRVIILGFYMISVPIIFYRLKKEDASIVDVWLGPAVGAIVEVGCYLILLMYYFDY